MSNWTRRTTLEQSHQFKNGEKTHLGTTNVQTMGLRGLIIK